VEKPSKVQLGRSTDGDLREAMDLLLSRAKGKVEVRWVRGHADKRVSKRAMQKAQRGNVRADAICTAAKKLTRWYTRPQLPREA
jgi:ribonuclease HI